VALAWKPKHVHPLSLLAALIVIGLAALVPALAWELARGDRMHVHAGSVAAILYVGAFPGFVSYVFWNRGVEAVGANRASLFLHLIPVFGTLLAAIFLGEVPRWYHALGVALIFSGIWLTTRQRPLRPQESRSPG
jgi:drug/metabolite transporter (DMT)-like permease